MIIEFVTVSASRRKRQELGRSLASLIGPIQAQPGCLSCQLFQARQDQNGLLMEARWENQEGLVSHLQSDTYKKLLLLIELSAAPPRLEFLTVVETHGLDLVEGARNRSDNPRDRLKSLVG